VSSKLADQASRICHERIYATAIQSYVSINGNLVQSGSWGTNVWGEDISAESLFQMYCLSKPVVGAAIVAFLARTGISPDEPLRPWLRAECAPSTIEGIPKWLTNDLSIRDILAHNAGLDQPDAAAFLLNDPAGHGSMVYRSPISSGQAYSEYLAGWMVDWLARSRGTTLAGEVEEYISQLGLADELRIGRVEVSDSFVSRLVPSVGGLPLRAIPILSDLTALELHSRHPYFGGLATAVGLGRWMEMAAGLRMRPDASDAPSLWGSLGVRKPIGAFDRRLKRSASFSNWAMTDLGAQGICSSLTDSTVGHTTGYFPSIIAADLETGLVVSIFVNGMNSGADLAFVRASLVNAACSDAYSGADQ
jgi:CubicO group peptidase (beta-lactamase class C family)